MWKDFPQASFLQKSLSSPTLLLLLPFSPQPTVYNLLESLNLVTTNPTLCITLRDALLIIFTTEDTRLRREVASGLRTSWGTAAGRVGVQLPGSAPRPLTFGQGHYGA